MLSDLYYRLYSDNIAIWSANSLQGSTYRGSLPLVPLCALLVRWVPSALASAGTQSVAPMGGSQIA